jgi:hypothetical protein
MVMIIIPWKLKQEIWKINTTKIVGTKLKIRYEKVN